MCNTKSKDMTFGGALAALNNGECVYRKNCIWNIYSKQVPSNINADIIPKMTSLNDRTKDILINTCKRINYNNQILVINLSTGDATQYIPTAKDLQAEDWCIVTDSVLEEIKTRLFYIK